GDLQAVAVIQGHGRVLVVDTHDVSPGHEKAPVDAGAGWCWGGCYSAGCSSATRALMAACTSGVAWVQRSRNSLMSSDARTCSTVGPAGAGASGSGSTVNGARFPRVVV